MSRAPLREALALLASQGLLIYAPNRGYSVRAFSVADIRAAFEIRGRLASLVLSHKFEQSDGLRDALAHDRGER